MPFASCLLPLLITSLYSKDLVLFLDFHQLYELRRPAADYLRNDIWELRAKQGTIQYRILYFYHGQDIAIIGDALIKKTSAVPSQDIERIIQRKAQFKQNPELHTYQGEI
nr:type II toxin-antitoxin system RelE/ParE family toxin [Microcystis aeruginosa]